MFTLQAWAKAEHLPFPLMSDYGGSLARSYGVWNDQTQLARRSLFVVDSSGVVRYRNLEVKVDQLSQVLADITQVLETLSKN